MSVITAVELQDDITSSEGASQAYGAHCRLGAAGYEPHHRHVRHALADQYAELNLQLGRHTERGPALHRLLERVKDDRRCVAKDQRTPGENEVDVFLAVHIPDARALAACGDHRLATDAMKCSHRRIHSAGKEFARARHHIRGSHASVRNCRS